MRDDSGVPDEVVFTPEPADAEPGAGLLRAMSAEIAALYDIDLNGPEMPSGTPADFAAPGGTFLVGRLGDDPVACGGIKRLPDGACEIKRMFVMPHARGAGVGGALLEALEDAARDLGYGTVRLDTGPLQPLAQAMYERAGYRPIHNFNSNPVATFFGEKRLSPAAPGSRETRRRVTDG